MMFAVFAGRWRITYARLLPSGRSLLFLPNVRNILRIQHLGYLSNGKTTRELDGTAVYHAAQLGKSFFIVIQLTELRNYFTCSCHLFTAYFVIYGNFFKVFREFHTFHFNLGRRH